MHTYFLKLIAALVVLLASSSFAASAMQMDHGKSSTDNPCADPSKPPSLNCGLAPSATFDGNGRLWLAWAFAGHVYVNHSDDKGESFSPTVVVNRIPEGISARGENRPKIAIDGDGRVFISWTTPLQKKYTGHVRFSRSLDGGEHFSDPVTVNDNLEITGHRFEAMGVNKRGDIYLAWLDKRDRLRAKREGNDYRGAALYYALSDDHGASFLPNVKIQDNTCECCRVVMDMDVDQLPVVMWRNIYDKNTRDHALVKFVDKNKAGSPVRVSYDYWKIDACPHHGPAISISDDGVYHMVWFDNAPERHGLFYARSSDRARSFSEPINFGKYEATASHPHVLSLGQKVYVVWREYDGKQSTIQLMKSSNGGKSWDDPEVLAETDGESDYPFLLANGLSIYLYWQTQKEGFRLLTIDGAE